MAVTKYISDTALQTIFNTAAPLANTARAVATYDNKTALDLFCDIFFSARYLTTAPAVNAQVASLFLLPGDGATTEVFPVGDTSTNPQNIFLIGVFQTRLPSTDTLEPLGLGGIPLYPNGNRFLIQNISGQTYQDGWTLKIKPSKTQTV